MIILDLAGMAYCLYFYINMSTSILVVCLSRVFLILGIVMIFYFILGALKGYNVEENTSNDTKDKGSLIKYLCK